MASRTLGLSADDLARVREIESLARQLAYLCLPERTKSFALLTKIYAHLSTCADALYAAHQDLGTATTGDELRPVVFEEAKTSSARQVLPPGGFYVPRAPVNLYTAVCMQPLVRRSVFSLCIQVNSIACELARSKDFVHAVVCAQTLVRAASLLLKRVRESTELADRLSLERLPIPPFAAPLTADLTADMAALHRLGRAFMQPDTVARHLQFESMQRFIGGIIGSKATHLNVLFHDLQVNAHQFVLALMGAKKPRTGEEWRRALAYVHDWVKLEPHRFDPALRAYLSQVCTVLTHYSPEAAHVGTRLQQLLTEDTRTEPEKLLCVPITELRAELGTYFSLLPADLIPILDAYFPSGQLDHLSRSHFGSLIARVLEFTPEEWAHAFYRTFYTELKGLHGVIGTMHRDGLGMLDSSDLLLDGYIRKVAHIRMFLRASIYLSGTATLNHWMQVAELSIELNDFCTSIILYNLLAEPVSRAHKAVDHRLLRQFSSLRKWTLVWPEFERRMREASSMSLASFIPALGMKLDYSVYREVLTSAASAEFINVWTAFHRFARLPAPVDSEMELFDLISHRLVCMSALVQRAFFSPE